MNKKIIIFFFLSLAYSCNNPNNPINTNPTIKQSPVIIDNPIIKNPNSSLGVNSVHLPFERLGFSISAPQKDNLIATVQLSDGSIENDVDWISSDDSIASISKYGKLTGYKEGSVIITAVSRRDYTKYAKFVLVVYSDNFLPKWSPTSDKVAFISNRNGIGQLFVMNSDGTEQKNISPNNNSLFLWSPKEEKLAYPSSNKISINNLNGEIKDLVLPTTNFASLSWSPDGKKIAFIYWNSEAGGNGIPEICLVNSDGSNFIKISINKNPLAFHWSPDSSKLAYIAEGNDLNVYDINTNKNSAIIQAKYFSWLPDSSKIIFVPVIPNELPSDYDITSPIFKINSDGSNQEIFLANQGLEFSNMVLSPDRTKIAVIGSKQLTGLSYGSKQDNIYIISSDGKNIKSLTNISSNSIDMPDPDGNIFKLNYPKISYESSPVWSPDSKNIVLRAKSNIQGNGVGFRNTTIVSVETGIYKEYDILSQNTGYKNEEVAWSPDSKKIVYESTKSSKENLNNIETKEVYSLDINSSQMTKLTNNNSINSKKQISDIQDKNIIKTNNIPINRNELKGSLVYKSKSQIYIIKPNTNNSIQLTHDDSEKSNIKISPDGKKIAFFYSSRNIADVGITIINSGGTNLIKLPNIKSIGYNLKWSPDSKKILFTTDKIYTINSDGTNLLTLSDVLIQNSFPIWSPDGSKISFVKNNLQNSEFYIINSDGSNKQLLFTVPGFINHLSWSPDGNRIAYSTSDIFTVNTDGSDNKKLTNSTLVSRFNELPEWSPDSKKILYTKYYQSEVVSSIAVMDSDGSNNKEITTPEDGAFSPKWSDDQNFIYFMAGKSSFENYNNSNYSMYIIRSDGTSQLPLIEKVLDSSDIDFSKY